MLSVSSHIKTYLDNTIIDHLLEGFQLISPYWRYLYINETVAKHGRCSKEDLLGYTMMEKYTGIENTEMFKLLEWCMNERVSANMENDFTYPDGTKGCFELRIQPVPEGLFVLSMDVSDRKRAEEELRNLNALLEEKVALRTSELEVKNKDITDSIKYAKRIQLAKLPSKREVSTALPDSFILYKPKDIVSGDFYYLHQAPESVILASADCTGHGVPGALLSMLCSEKLNDSVSKHDNISDILRHLNKGVKASLRQSEMNDTSRDGMDIALCSVDMKAVL